MNAPNISGKQRASRIPLDYYKHGDNMTRRKTLWTRIALWASVGWCVLLVPGCLIEGLNSTPVGEQRYSHGPICKGHADFGHKCSACHVNFPMLTSSADVSGQDSGARSSFKGDLLCLECHLGSKTDRPKDAIQSVHHKGMLANMTPNCGTCHTDHKGIDKDLRRVADANCTGCHKNVVASREGPGKFKPTLGDVSSFADNHPEFRSATKEDPSKIKFNHAYHMTPGIVLAEGGKAFTVADMVDVGDGKLKNAVRTRGDVVKLDCADCHRTEERNDRSWAGSAPEAKQLTADAKGVILKAFDERRQKREWDQEAGVLMPPRTPGAYMEPIKYDNHCATCHPLSLDNRSPRLSHPGKGFELKQYLEREVVPNVAAPAPVSTSALIGKIGAPPPESGPVKVGATLAARLLGKPEEVRRQLIQEEARGLLFQGTRNCTKCHLDDKGNSLSFQSETIARPEIPEVWFKHARFDHAQHASRGISCKECHPQAYASNTNILLDLYTKKREGAEVMMIPAIDNCRQCHSPKPTNKAQAAKHDCTECHIYHQGK